MSNNAAERADETQERARALRWGLLFASVLMQCSRVVPCIGRTCAPSRPALGTVAGGRAHA